MFIAMSLFTMSLLKSILSDSSRLSASSRRPEDMEMPILVLYTERGRCWDYTWDWKWSVLFVLYDDLFCVKDAVVEVCRRISFALLGCFPVIRFFNVRLRTYAPYASEMIEFTCSEHSVRIRTSKKTQHRKSTPTRCD